MPPAAHRMSSRGMNNIQKCRKSLQKQKISNSCNFKYGRYTSGVLERFCEYNFVVFLLDELSGLAWL